MTSAWKMVHRARRVHLVGIGGSGMSGVAEVLLRLGHDVRGSDLRASEATERLRAMGARITIGHDGDLIEGSDVVVFSTAISADNPELTAARASKLPVIRRAEMLAELMRLHYGVVVAGSHGKTTTSAMVTTILAEVGLDPTAIIGGRPVDWASSARVGSSGLMVAEGDESDGSFLHLTPTYLLLTNLDPEHLDHYGGRLERLDDAFVELTERVPFWGTVIYCGDDPGLDRIRARINRPTISYGTAETCDFRLESTKVTPEGTVFRFRVEGETTHETRVPALGRHNASNALGAIAVARELGVDVEQAAAAVPAFRGVDRRFSLRGEARGIAVVDDYGHHPTEIRATLGAAREAHPARRLLVGFQPHRYTRTRDLMSEFAGSFEDADELWLAPVYPAGEALIPGATAERLAAAIGQRSSIDVHLAGSLERLEQDLAAAAADGDVIILLGAGDIHRSSQGILRRLRGEDSA